MISVETAIATILKGASALSGETVALSDVVGRIAAEDIHATLTQPPFSASAMDGYAVQFADMAKGKTLEVIGEAPAGSPFTGTVQSGEAVRIFTGGAVPTGADHVIIQENISRSGDVIIINEEQARPANIRAAGVDFHKGDRLVSAGTVFHEMHGALLAAANIKDVPVLRQPKVALFSNGDELVEPGSEVKSGQIINSNHYALSAMITLWGGEAIYLGRAPDDEAAIIDFFKRGGEVDILIPIGGASVGDYDYVKSAFEKAGGVLDFSKVAVRPGKPTWSGRINTTRIIGLPGNPASAIVTAALFVQPLVRALSANYDHATRPRQAILESDIPANGKREHYVRALCAPDDTGQLVVAPAPNQDSSLLTPFAQSNVLVRRSIDAPALLAGDEAEIVWLR